MAVIDDDLAALKTKVTAQTTVVASVKTLVLGFPALLAAAVASAGLSPAQAQIFTELQDQIQTNTDELAAAVVAGTGTPANPPPAGP